MKIIGIAGGTASGKTTSAGKLYELSKCIGQVTIIRIDNYYKDRSHLVLSEREKINYDHPNAFDIELLVNHLNKLIDNQSIDMPVYNFESHTRGKNTVKIQPTSVIILEGILVLFFEELRKIIDVKIYVDTPDDLRFIRRLQRDISKRGRTLESVINQYMETVRPMHEAFVLQSKIHADIIVPEGGENKVAIDILNNTILSLINSPTSSEDQ